MYLKDEKQLDALIRDVRRAVANNQVEFTPDGLMVINSGVGISVGGVFDTKILRHELVQDAIDRQDPEREEWARSFIRGCGDVTSKRGYFEADSASNHNLVPTAGLTFNLSLLFGTQTKVSSWYIALFTSNSSVDSTWAGNWAGASSGPKATELADASYDESGRQAATFPSVATSGAIATSSPTAYTLATGTSGVSIYGAVLTNVATVAYNSTDKVLFAATLFGTAKTGLGAADVISTNYSITCASS